jgi:hypothetical protein
VSNIDLKQSEFTSFLERYKLLNKTNLNIISVFRDPMERLISSFFQWHGSRPFRDGEVSSEAETLILKLSIPELHNIFINQYCENPEVPIFESLDDICRQFSFSSSDLKFSESSATGINYLENCNLYLFRFDLLVQDLTGLLSSITGNNIELVNKNIGSSKFYADQYQQFRETLRMPVDTIGRVYETRKGLLDVFFSSGYQFILDRAISRFGSTDAL